MANVCPVPNGGNFCGATYRSSFTKNDLIGTATVVTTAGQFTRLGEYKVLAGDLIALGYGDCNCQNTAVGRIFVDLATAPATPLYGTIRISSMSASDRPNCILFEARTDILSLNATLRSEWLPLSENNVWLSQDKRYELSFNPDTTGTITLADSTIFVDITKEDV